MKSRAEAAETTLVSSSVPRLNADFDRSVPLALVRNKRETFSRKKRKDSPSQPTLEQTGHTCCADPIPILRTG